MSKRLLCVWLPNWPVQRVQAEEPQLANTPLVLSARDPRRGFVIAAANLAARAAGVRSLMRLSEAQALVDCVVREHEPDEDIEMLCTLAEQAQQFSPIVGFEQLDKKLWAGRTLHQPESLLLDITGLASLFGGEAALVHQVADWLARQKYFGCLGVASSVGAAWAIANFATRDRNRHDVTPKTLRVSGDLQRANKPNAPSPQPSPPRSAGERERGEYDRQPSRPRSVGEREQDECGAQLSSSGNMREGEQKRNGFKNARPSSGEKSEQVSGANSLTPMPSVHDSDEMAASLPECRYCIATLEDEADIIAGLPLVALRLQFDTIQSLRRLGIYTIGQLETLPRSGMASRLGAELISRWDQVLGKKNEPVVTLHSRPDWCLEQSLDVPTRHWGTIIELVRRLSHELSLRLSRRGDGALRIVCRLDLYQTQPMVMQLGLFRPSNDAQHIEFLLVGQLEQQLRRLGRAEVWRVSLQATMTASMKWRQVDLFDGGEATSRAQIARLVDKLSGRLGRKQVLSAKVKREAQPEAAFNLVPMTGRRVDGSEQDTVKKISSRISRKRAEPSRDDPLRRPTHLFDEPLAISVKLPRQPVEFREDVNAEAPAIPRQLATSPEQFYHRGQWLQVTSAQGPERLESGWWRGPSVRRDYYRVATEQGSWWWLYRDLNSGKWFLHGMFD